MDTITENRSVDTANCLDQLRTFTETPNFKNLLKTLYSIDFSQRKSFVEKFILNPTYVAEYGIILPEGVTIERSFFYDERPTLFCVVKYLSDQRRKVTVTFDNN